MVEGFGGKIGKEGSTDLRKREGKNIEVRNFHKGGKMAEKGKKRRRKY